MIELVFLALLNRLTSWGVTPLIATRTVAADAATLHQFLSEPDNQLRLLRKVPRDLEVQVQPRAKGRVVCVEILRRRRTVLWATWILSAGRGTTEVDLAVQFQTRGVATRLMLVLGGRRWLARRIDGALARLGQVCARAAEDIAPAPLGAPAPDCSRRTRRTRSAPDASREASHTR
ncbi:MAG TPA: hypothetical protein VGV90_08110 [Solirubrobacteraceae bacterium]|nr:hypothetical protein [Solirubrobacteraceae bacterium]